MIYGIDRSNGALPYEADFGPKNLLPFVYQQSSNRCLGLWRKFITVAEVRAPPAWSSQQFKRPLVKEGARA
jgi:hypothetical protein